MQPKPFKIPYKIIHTNEDGTKDEFICNEILGHGTFAFVYKVQDQSTNQTYAMKVISKEKRSKKILERIKNEIEIQSFVNHQNLVKLEKKFSDENNFYIVLEFCQGKTIRDFLKNQKDGYFNETETRKIIKEIVKGVQYLHNNQITHYDLKLENYIINSKGNVKICDFGLSAFHKDEEGKRYSLSGTPNYLSPEIVNKEPRENTTKADIWAIGVSAFIMLTGKGPFEGVDKETTLENTRNCRFSFPSNRSISPEAKDFIQKILQKDPRKRPTAEELLEHPFLDQKDGENDNTMNKTSKLPQLTSTQKLRVHLPMSNAPKLVTSPRNNQKVINSPRNNQKVINSPRNNQKVINSPRNNQKVIGSPRNNQKVISSPRYTPKLVTSPRNNHKITGSPRKNFSIPEYFVSRYCFYNDDLGYLFGDGTVGVCFQDQARIVMDPNEKFAQFYRSINSFPTFVNLDDFREDGSMNLDENDPMFSYVSKLLKFASHLKKYKFYFNLPSVEYDSSSTLHNVKCYVKKDDSILFKIDDKNFQVFFNDHVKMIIFWNSKKTCFFRNIKEKCSLLDLNYVAGMNPNCDEVKKYKNAKELLSNISITI